MADSVKIVMDQIDEETGQPISHVVCEWYGMDRNEANALSMGIADGVVDAVTGAAEGKAQMSGDGPMAEALKSMRRR